jgi:hypothetical protein
VHHLAHDWTRSDDGDLDNQVIKLLWAIARERGHLGSALHLKHPDGISLLQGFISTASRQLEGSISNCFTPP